MTSDHVARTVGRALLWVVVCCVVAAGAAYVVSKRQPEQYTATAALVFNENQQAQQVAGLPITSNGDQAAQQNTNVSLVELGDMAARTAAQLHEGLTKESVKADLAVSSRGESNIVEVSATAGSPVLAARIANSYTRDFVREQTTRDHAYYASALKLVEGQLAKLTPRERAGANGLAIQARAQSLAILSELRNSSVQVAEPAAVPNSPTSPKVARNVALAGLLGALLGLCLFWLFDGRARASRRMRANAATAGGYGATAEAEPVATRAESATASRPPRAREREPLEDAVLGVGAAGMAGAHAGMDRDAEQPAPDAQTDGHGQPEPRHTPPATAPSPEPTGGQHEPARPPPGEVPAHGNGVPAVEPARAVAKQPPVPATESPARPPVAVAQAPDAATPDASAPVPEAGAFGSNGSEAPENPYPGSEPAEVERQTVTSPPAQTRTGVPGTPRSPVPRVQEGVAGNGAAGTSAPQLQPVPPRGPARATTVSIPVPPPPQTVPLPPPVAVVHGAAPAEPARIDPFWAGSRPLQKRLSTIYGRLARQRGRSS